MDDKRIGKTGETWPDVTITGRAYQRPVSTVTIGNGYFVVLDTFPTSDQDELLDSLRHLVDQPKSKRRYASESTSEES